MTRKTMVSVFLSHSSKDKEFARKLAQDLTSNDIKVWFDEAELKIGDSLILKITDAIKRNDYVAFIISKNSVNSIWVKKELAIALTEEIQGKKIKVLPILIDECTIPSFIEDKLYADFRSEELYMTEFKKLLKAINVPLKTLDSEIKTHFPEESRKFPDISFQPIRIIGIDRNKISKPHADKDLYNVYFELSQLPNNEWCQLFEALWDNAFYSMRRKSWTEGKYIVMYCGLDEIQKYHIKELNQKVNETNTKYQQWLNIKRQKGEDARKKKIEEDSKIEETISKIDFS